jgi:beta-glucanase (GH16 family)/lysophospholipase L1-like esterase
MRLLLIILGVHAVLFICQAQETVNPNDRDKWELAWSDEFNYNCRDELLLNWEAQNGTNTHILCSRWEENIEVGNGVVKLVNRKETRAGQDWTSASIWTRRLFKYGYFECRYKYASETGTNNSFWIMTRGQDSDPKTGKRFEIDINEGHYPDEVNMNIHNWSDIFIHSEGKQTHPAYHTGIKCDAIDFSKEYHVFGLEWNENEIVFYLDRKEIRREKNAFCFSAAPVLLSLAVIQWAGEVTDRIDGTFMEVDYVRVYRKKSDRPVRIMGMGNSLTEGSATHQTYLYPLRDILAAAGYNAEFIGPRENRFNAHPVRHAGFSGRTAEFLESVTDSIYRIYPADIVLLHAGHNHFDTEKPVSGIVVANRSIINKILNINPSAKIFVAQVIEVGKLPKYSYIPELNDSLAAMVSALYDPRVVLVNQAAGFDWKIHTIEDKVHTNDAGAKQMAQTWFDVLKTLKP